MKNILLLSLALSASFPVFARAAETNSADSTNPYMQETKAQHDARMKWMRDARFGMFIHWGLYSQAAGEWNGRTTDGAGEWMMNDFQIPLSQYAKLVPQFNPVKFDAREWVRIAKDAGMKYIVITTKHHEGFAMYPTALTDWSIKSTPFHRDPLKELSVACKEAGITLCFYHSIMDWHNPEYAPRKPWNDIDKNPPDFDHYVAFMKGQLKELLTNYGPIGLLWFDGHWENTWNYDRGVDLYKYVRSLQPNIIVNNRVGQDRAGQSSSTEGQARIGDYGTPEQTIPANGFGPGVDWETCMTMNNTWGYKKSDNNWKSTTTLIHDLVDIASKGGNYLLNVGPTGEGLIPDASIDHLKAIGQWMHVNGPAIYATVAGPFPRQLPWGRCTQKQGSSDPTLYLHVFDWPADGQLLVPGLKNSSRKAYLLADSNHHALATKATPEGLLISVPTTAPDAISSTIVLQVRGALHIEPTVLSQKPDGSIQLPAVEARLHGTTLQYENGDGHDNIGYWFKSGEWLDWEFQVRTPGKFEVLTDIASPATPSFDITLGNQTIHCTAPATGDYGNFKPVTLGIVDIPAPGKATLSVHPVKDGWQPMNLKTIRLKPVTAQ
ncbi:MAG: putative glycosyl hydrolase [Pedosphaera sp.]|nr:putative glycosyl hydrolase [Pedosphaera sp.]